MVNNKPNFWVSYTAGHYPMMHLKCKPSLVPTFTRFPESKHEGLRREVDVGYACPLLKREYLQYTARENKCTKPDPSVHNIPPSHWPPKDTPILPISSSANEVWNSCTRESRRRNYRRTDNLSNSALGDGQREDQVQLDPNEKYLHKLERLPPDQRKLVIDDIRPEDFSSQEYARIRAINGDRAKNYLHKSGNGGFT
uniref:Uncharacterized protein n=1 Tax=Magallana gigas TaxID=29159 RepID=K1Q254_MAGGI